MGLLEGLQRTREKLGGGFRHLFAGKLTVNSDMLEEVENILLSADVGISATQHVMKNLTKRHSLKKLDQAGLHTALREEMLELLKPVSYPLVVPDQLNSPFVVFMIGVNGTGKTTTIGKLAHRWLAEGRSVALAAADTFRAAAVDQLIVWGERNNVPVTHQKPGADPAAVVYEALEKATSKHTDILIADTAGRLHTQSHLMEQLKKVHRSIKKLNSNAPHETMLVLDATTGQNALMQAMQFHEAVNITGITLTKLDGTAKGGIIFAIAEKLKVPIRFIGLGEKKEDLRVFEAAAFVDALLGN